ncbi:MAG: hypothetical protein JW862_14500 [Anaerolineales bacterium]|nr:hypothetical protein [Anaerolineales bacterium]
MNRVQSEKGQAIVLLVFAIIGLLGFTALAIDGSMVYSDRRIAQNAADAATLAAAGHASLHLENNFVTFQNFNCGTSIVNNARSTAVTMATNVANQHGYTDTAITGVDVNTTCVNNGNAPDDRYIDITTTITQTAQTALAQMFYSQPIVNQVTATSRIHLRMPLALGNAIVALNTANCQGQQNGATFHGNAQIQVYGGGIWTNGCLRGNGGPDVDVYNGSISYVGQVISPGLFNPAPTQANEIMPPELYAIPAPDCGHANAHHVNARDIVGKNATALSPGLYCVSGDLRVNGNDSLIGSGVTIYLLDGGLTINGNATVQLTAPAFSPDPNPALPGILFMTAAGNNSRVQINGNSVSYFHGTILAIESDIDFLGTGYTDAYNTQVIGYNVEVGGTADTFVTYFNNTEYSRPTSLELYE